jgi:hypothetical protein
MADDVTYQVNADSTPPNGTIAATDETTSGPHAVGAQMGIAKLAVSADGDSTHLPATVADGLLVDVSNSSLTVEDVPSTVATTTQVADNAASVTLLASNAARLGAVIENDSSAVLYVKLGATASTTDYTVRMVRYAYFEVPYSYTGRIDGIWASDPNDGAARVTELT